MTNACHNSDLQSMMSTYQSKSVGVLALLWKYANQDDSNDIPQPLLEFKVNITLGFSEITGLLVYW